jgi:hypothetical protein
VTLAAGGCCGQKAAQRFKGVCPPDVANECRLTEVELPVDSRSEFMFYQAMTDEKLVGVPSCSFLQLYTSICGDGKSTMEALDRAVNPFRPKLFVSEEKFHD